MRRHLPVHLFIFVTLLWFGIDFTFLRDLTGQFTYYGSIPPGWMDNIFGTTAITGSILLLIGITRNAERCGRLGLVLGGASYIMFAIGMLLKSLVHTDSDFVASWFSAATPGFNYLLLGAFLILAGIRRWNA